MRHKQEQNKAACYIYWLTSSLNKKDISKIILVGNQGICATNPSNGGSLSKRALTRTRATWPLSAGRCTNNAPEREARTLRGFQKRRHKVDLLQKEAATVRMTTALQVKGLKGSGRAITWKCTEKGKVSLLPWPALESAMEEKVAVGSPHSQKTQHRIDAKAFGYLSCSC